MRPIEEMKFLWFWNRNLSAWEIHARKQLIRKIFQGLIVVTFIGGGVFVFLFESGKLNFLQAGGTGSVKIIQVEPENTDSMATKDSLVAMVNTDGNKQLENQEGISLADDRHPLPVDSGILASIIHEEVNATVKNDTLNIVNDKCGVMVKKQPKKLLSNSQEYWYSPPDLAFAERLKISYSGCVLAYLEQPYATVALAVTAINAYQQDELKDFNFMGEKIWAGKKFRNASEYFEEFSRVYNPAEIEDTYFDQYQGKGIPLAEQYWRAYLEKYFPNIQPKAIREIMRRWGYGYTET